MRFGLVDVASGACNLLVATRREGEWTTTTIESFGRNANGEAELIDHIKAWTHAGSPSFDQPTVEINYGDVGLGEWVLRTLHRDGHTISLGWSRSI